MADSNPMEEKFAGGGTCMYLRGGAGGGSFPAGTGETNLLRGEKE